MLKKKHLNMLSNMQRKIDAVDHAGLHNICYSLAAGHCLALSVNVHVQKKIWSFILNFCIAEERYKGA